MLNKILKSLGLVILFSSLLAGAVFADVDELYRMSLTGIVPPFDISKTYNGNPTTEIRGYLYMAVTGTFTNIGAGAFDLDGDGDNPLVDSVQYGISINGYWLDPATQIFYWDADAICFLIPEGIFAGYGVDIQVIDNFVAAPPFTIDYLPPDPVYDFEAEEDEVMNEIDLSWSNSYVNGGYNDVVANNCGILIVRVADNMLDTMPVNGTTYPIDGDLGNGVVVFDDQGSSASDNPMPEPDHFYRYYAFIHDGTPNYNLTEVIAEYDFLFPQTDIDGIWEADGDGDPIGDLLTRAVPGFNVTVTGEGFTQTGTIRFIDADTGTVVYSAAEGADLSWYTDGFDVGHANFEIPEIPYGVYDIELENAYLKVDTIEAFEVVEDLEVFGPPVLDSVLNHMLEVTTEARIDDYIYITGTDIGQGCVVTFETTPAVVIDASSTEAEMNVPTMAAGDITITVSNQYGAGTISFRILPPENVYSFVKTRVGDGTVTFNMKDNDEALTNYVIYSDVDFPVPPIDPADPNLLYNGSGPTAHLVTAESLVNEQAYYFSAYAFDGINYSDPINVVATPSATATAPLITLVEAYDAEGYSTTEARVGAKVHIEGERLGSGAYEVYFDGVLATYDLSETQNEYSLMVFAPIVAEGEVEVTVENPNNGEISDPPGAITIIPPDPVYDFRNHAEGNEQIRLKVRDNDSAGVQSTVVVYSTTDYPTSPAEAGVTEVHNDTPTGESYYITITGLTNEQIYYFSAFAYDGENYSERSTAAGTPSVTASAPVIDYVEAWYGEAGDVTDEARVGANVGIGGERLGSGTYEVYFNGELAAYAPGETQSEYYLLVVVPVMLTEENVEITVVNPTNSETSNAETIDIIPPAPVYDFRVNHEGNGSIRLATLDNVEDGVQSTVIVYTTEGYALSPTDAGVIEVHSGTPTSEPYYITVSDLINGTTYYFSAFAFDGINYSAAVNDAGVPSAAASEDEPVIDHLADSEGAVTTEAKVGGYLGIQGTNLGGLTSTVYVAGIAADFNPGTPIEDQGNYFLAIQIPQGVPAGENIEVIVENVDGERSEPALVDILSPEPISYFDAASGNDGWIPLTWINSTWEAGFAGVMIRVSTDAAPADQTEGDLIGYFPVEDGVTSYNDTGLVNGTTYYYSAFAYDGANYSAPVSDSATPDEAGDEPPEGEPQVNGIYAVLGEAGTLSEQPTDEAAEGEWIAILGSDLGDAGQIAFFGPDDEYIYIDSEDDGISWYDDGSQINVQIPENAQSGYITVILEDGTEIVIDTFFTVTGTDTDDPSISTISPTSGVVGSTVTIFGTNLGDGNVGTTDNVIFSSGGNETYAQTNSWTDTQIVAIVPEVALGTYEVYVKVDEENSNYRMFEVVEDGAGSAASFIIDDFEGVVVDPATYYLFDDDTSKPEIATQSATVYEGNNAMQVLYNHQFLHPGDWGGGFGGVLSESIDISDATKITLMLKGDGSANTVRIELVEDDAVDGETWMSGEIVLADDQWREYSFNLDEFTVSEFGADGNGTLDRTIGGYQIVYTTQNASSAYHYIDYIIATGEAVDPGEATPVITSVSPPQAITGSTVTITGYNFGDNPDGLSEVRFSGDAIVSDAISSWSDTQIVFTVPAEIVSGNYDLQVYRKETIQAIDALSEAVGFRVIALTTTAVVYPNPFNPNAESITIQVSVTEAMTAKLYLYDTTARIVHQAIWSLAVGTNETTWNGRNYVNGNVGDGVYLLRVVNQENNELISKAKILVIKR